MTRHQTSNTFFTNRHKTMHQRLNKAANALTGCFFLMFASLTFAQGDNVTYLFSDKTLTPADGAKKFLYAPHATVIIPSGVTATPGFSVAPIQPANPHIDPNLLKNFTLQEVPRIPGIVHEDQLDERDENSVLRAVTYFDATGRTQQETLIKSTPGHQDFIQGYDYVRNEDDSPGAATVGFDFERKAYLPITGEYDGDYLYSYASRALDYYDPDQDCDPNGDIPCDKRPFTTTIQEESPGRRPLQQIGVGSTWEENETHFKRLALHFSERIPVFTLDANGLPVYAGRNYVARSLMINEQVTYPYETDVTQRTRTYTDKTGRRIASKTQAIQRREDYNDTDAYRFTYQVYNAFGNVAYVFPPHLMHLLNEPGGWRSPTEQELNAYAYHYVYDEYIRPIARTVPGGYTEYTLYDIWDRPVLTQNEKDRIASQWSFVKYDRLGRPAITGKLTTTQTREQLQSALNNATVRFEAATPTGGNHGYTNHSFPTASHGTQEVYTVVYYDNYQFLSQPYFPFQSGSTLEQLYNDQSGHGYQVAANVIGLVTGIKTKVLGEEDRYLHTVSLYNKDERLIQTSGNDFLGKTNLVNIKYDDFTGEVTETVNVYDVAGEYVQIKETFTYDHVGRPLTHTQQVGSSEPVTLARNQYNELGQLIDLKLHSPDENTFAQSIDYRYDIRGALELINNPDLDDGEDDAFSMRIHRKADLRTGSIFRRLDGLITSINWKHKGQEHHRYDYNYDPLGQLTNAWYLNLTNGSTNDAFSVNGANGNKPISYDLSGNIQALSRKSLGEMVDNLEYTYEEGSHRLAAVTDKAQENNKAILFDEQNTTPDDYSYDESGNLIEDKNKGITNIRYNDLGFTEQVTFDNGTTIDYRYDASGAKLQKLVTQRDGSTDQTDYIGNAQYENGTLTKLFHPYGQIKDPTSMVPDYQYFINDHVGSVRSVVSQMKTPENTVTRTFGGEAGETPPDVLTGTVIASEAQERENYYEMIIENFPQIFFELDLPSEGTMDIEAWIKGEEKVVFEVYSGSSDVIKSFTPLPDRWQKINFTVNLDATQTGWQAVIITPGSTPGPRDRKIQIDDIS
ncbi:MAG: hypothetical protein AAGA66_16855, partial [Bacteroidota bacterium]